ncbi:MAG: glycosyltransferase [Oscillospiraceae bacterium]|nr:glycosyltransferase [Oscillospiraceae bacterium]
MDKIKITFVNHQLVWGGAERALFDLINLLDKDKFDITLFVQSDAGPWSSKFVDAGIRVMYDYSCRQATWNPIKKAGNVIKKLRTQESYKQGGRGLLDVCCPGADIVVSYSVWDNEELIFAEGAKTVKYYHGDCGTNPVYREEALKTADMLKRFDRIVCVSDASCKSFKELTGLEDTVQMHFNPMDSDAVLQQSKVPVQIDQDIPVVCAVGRLSEEKGFDRLVYIHKNLLKQGIRHKLLIVGDGPDRQHMEHAIAATGTQDTVIMVGYQSNPYPYIKQCKFLVNSSYTEGLPVIAMEALCLGTPIVAAVPSVGEAFGDEMCGLITANDNDALEEGIRKMLTDESLYAQAKAGAQKRSTFFDGKRMVKEIEEMFISLMQETN